MNIPLDLNMLPHHEENSTTLPSSTATGGGGDVWYKKNKQQQQVVQLGGGKQSYYHYSEDQYSHQSPDDDDPAGRLINNVVNNNNKSKMYQCRFCSQIFCKSQALGGHMNRHRQERETETLNKARQLVFTNGHFFINPPIPIPIPLHFRRYTSNPHQFQQPAMYPTTTLIPPPPLPAPVTKDYFNL